MNIDITTIINQPSHNNILLTIMLLLYFIHKTSIENFSAFKHCQKFRIS